MFFSVLIAEAQTQNKRVINGRVSTLNDLPVANFKVEAKKSEITVLTDSTGTFSIVTDPKDVLLFKSEVFRNQRVRVGKNVTDSVLVNLDYIPTPKNKQRAIGYGYVSEDDLVTAVSHLNSNNVDFCQYSDMFELIRGRFPNVEIKGSRTDPEVIIRGSNSIMASNEALYVVDGSVTSSINHITPCDVKSIDVLKDSGAAIYGSRGANGVVLIETRKGE